MTWTEEYHYCSNFLVGACPIRLPCDGSVIPTGTPNSAKFRGGGGFAYLTKGGGLQKFLNFYAMKISTF